MELLELFTDASKWTRGAVARNALGDATNSGNAEATCWCLVGAINKCHGGDDLIFKAARRAVIELFPSRRHSSNLLVVSQFNDHPDTTFDDIIRVIHRTELL